MPRTVFVIDDNNEILDLTRYSLEHITDISLQTFSNPVSALRKIESEGRPDLIITDLKMSSMNGVELLARLSIVAKTVPIIIFTGHAEVLPPGNNCYTVFKDAHGFEKLVDTVEDILKKQPAHETA